MNSITDLLSFSKRFFIYGVGCLFVFGGSGLSNGLLFMICSNDCFLRCFCFIICLSLLNHFSNLFWLLILTKVSYGSLTLYCVYIID